MLIKKITHGFVAQVFDTEKNEFISQEFIVGDIVEVEDEMGRPLKASQRSKIDDQYLPFDMLQPKDMVE